jgi:molybdenum cofactor guanylyltransferase
MGRDKALMRAHGEIALERIARLVCQSAGDVTVIGHPERYQALGLRAIADQVEGRGPLGGLFTALRVTTAEWNLIVACDMPWITGDVLREILSAAEQCEELALVPRTAHGLEPLCAAYHRDALSAVERAVATNRLAMRDFAVSIGARPWPVPDDDPRFTNANTLEEWKRREGTL